MREYKPEQDSQLPKRSDMVEKLYENSKKSSLMKNQINKKKGGCKLCQKKVKK